MVSAWCEGGRYGCGNPTTFVARHIDESACHIFACGKHLAALIKQDSERHCRNGVGSYVIGVVKDKPKGGNRTGGA